ncbi:MAG: hypothetical protein R3316_07205 [Rhodovibrionaceae bacterium]|nr:hypothetical protein [Rhodovibrionaceae bacterium]
MERSKFGDEGASARLAWAAGLARGIVLGIVLVLAACTYKGGADKPATFKFTWFSYVNGDDIRRQCTAETIFRARFVYNGSYNHQLRSYDVVSDGVGGAYVVARAMSGNNLTQFLRELSVDAWGWKKSEAKLNEAAFETLKTRFRESGVYGAAPRGLRLESDRYYWTSVVCQHGEVSFNAWQYPSERFAQLTFPKALLAADNTGVAFREPRELDPLRRPKKQQSPRAGDITGPYFELTVKENGLADLGGVFR